ncbi:integrase [Streptomyces sp. NPDC051561]|uniref:integrase n=1 Tax=Streptomyces sp. NPDC051561 TaxID=3365658 RepID=UPI0037B2C219
MYARLATSPGRPGRANEDFAGVVPRAAVLLDGAGIPGAESVCSHGVAWYTRRLGGTLLGHLSQDDGRSLPEVLAAAIAETAAAHQDTCDLSSPLSPQATVAIVRTPRRHLDDPALQGHRSHLELLLLGDSYLLLSRAGRGPQLLTDTREVTARRLCSAPLAGIPEDAPEYPRVRATCAEALRARRNNLAHKGSYWLAKEDPQAAGQAVTGSLSLSDLTSATLLSNGAARLVTPYALTDWPGALHLLATHGATGLLRRLRDAEERARPRYGAPDDATVVHCTFRQPHLTCCGT